MQPFRSCCCNGHASLLQSVSVTVPFLADAMPIDADELIPFEFFFQVCKLKDLRLSVWEFMAGLPGKFMSLLLPLLFAACVVYETVVNLITLHTWHLVFATTFAQVHHLFSLRLSATCIIASVASFAAFANTLAPFAVAPFARWVKRLKIRRWEWGWWGIDGWQVLALYTVESCLVVCLFLLNQCSLSATLFS